MVYHYLAGNGRWFSLQNQSAWRETVMATITPRQGVGMWLKPSTQIAENSRKLAQSIKHIHLELNKAF